MDMLAHGGKPCIRRRVVIDVKPDYRHAFGNCVGNYAVERLRIDDVERDAVVTIGNRPSYHFGLFGRVDAFGANEIAIHVHHFRGIAHAFLHWAKERLVDTTSDKYELEPSLTFGC